MCDLRKLDCRGGYICLGVTSRPKVQGKDAVPRLPNPTAQGRGSFHKTEKTTRHRREERCAMRLRRPCARQQRFYVWHISDSGGTSAAVASALARPTSARVDF
jgi:hypothetical protein